MGDHGESTKHALPLSGPGEPLPEPPQIDGYEIVGWLGGGGMGVVWRAKQLSTGRDVALKVVNQKVRGSKGGGSKPVRAGGHDHRPPRTSEYRPNL